MLTDKQAKEENMKEADRIETNRKKFIAFCNKQTKEDSWNYLRERLFDLPSHNFELIISDIIGYCGSSFTSKDLDYMEKLLKEKGAL